MEGGVEPADSHQASVLRQTKRENLSVDVRGTEQSVNQSLLLPAFGEGDSKDAIGFLSDKQVRFLVVAADMIVADKRIGFIFFRRRQSHHVAEVVARHGGALAVGLVVGTVVGRGTTTQVTLGALAGDPLGGGGGREIEQLVDVPRAAADALGARETEQGAAGVQNDRLVLRRGSHEDGHEVVREAVHRAIQRRPLEAFL